MADLDLSRGADDTSPPRSARAEREQVRRSATTRSGGSGSAATEQREATTLKFQLGTTFEKLAEVFDARDDEELATIFREDGEIMSKGLVSLTARIKGLRPPLLFFLAIVEPILAFGRLFRVLAGRVLSRREVREEEPVPA